MEPISQLLSIIKSPKTALVLFVFGCSLLYMPFEKVGLEQPEFTNEYRVHLTVLTLLAAAFLAVELSNKIASILMIPFRRRRRKKKVEELFFSLNLNELCVLWNAVQDGSVIVNGDMSKPTISSLQQKGAIVAIGGVQNALEANYRIPNDVFEIVKELGLDRFPDDWRQAKDFDKRVRDRSFDVINWRDRWN